MKPLTIAMTTAKTNIFKQHHTGTMSMATYQNGEGVNRIEIIMHIVFYSVFKKHEVVFQRKSRAMSSCHATQATYANTVSG